MKECAHLTDGGNSLVHGLVEDDFHCWSQRLRSLLLTLGVNAGIGMGNFLVIGMFESVADLLASWSAFSFPTIPLHPGIHSVEEGVDRAISRASC